MTDNIINALAIATKQWHQADRQLEALSHATADATRRKADAERDLHELGRLIELLESEGGSVGTAPGAGAGAAEAGNLETNQAGPTVAMPLVSTPGVVLPGNQVDEAAPSEIVLQQMQRARFGVGGDG